MGKPYNIGYTTGVFDVFHVGHLNILRQAKAQCEYLIVGVSTDELVKEYKHKCPVVPFVQRMAIVGAIQFVDQVVPQTSMDKLEAWKHLHYDVMFHGDDWRGSEMYEREIQKLHEVGAEVVFLKHTDGISSTMIVERIKESNDVS